VLTGGACQLTGLPDPDIQVLGRRVSWSARHHEPHRHHPTGPRPGRGHSAVLLSGRSSGACPVDEIPRCL
jgi:hypothetical protein